MTMRIQFLLMLVPFLLECSGQDPVPLNPDRYITENPAGSAFSIATSGSCVPVMVSAEDHEGVIRAVTDLQSDLMKVTGTLPVVIHEGESPETMILVGTAGTSPLIDSLAAQGKLDLSPILGRWEAFLTTVVEDPFRGVSRALVIAGSDRRGTIFGVYELSSQIGVSPWYFWADVPPRQNTEIHVRAGTLLVDEPGVKYRGIFINDEAPALSGWVHENFGAFNHHFYQHVFELILRMKGNYLWPAMWGRSFFDDDSLNAPMAEKYGIVIGTTHHEPLMRAHVEWSRYGEGPWDYRENPETLRQFWKEGIERMGSYESIVSIGMRGDGDAPMTRGTAIALLEEIVETQREIIGEATGKDPAETPQLWALYKEVQDYYDRGMRVPEDVTLLLSDDNWGNLRKLPRPGDPARAGGYGIYYHFDYVGGPRNYKWLNTNQIERVWEQMHLAWEHGVDRIWIVNVGDIKPMELPTQFFLDYAWDPEGWTGDRIPEYYRRWAAQQFGEEFAGPVAEMLADYTRFNARRKSELLSPDTYSLIHFREAERVVNEYNTLANKAEEIYRQVPARLRDAYFQLVLFPVKACANLNEMYVAAAMNRRYAEQGRASTNLMAGKVRELFRRDSAMTVSFHTELAGGKWNHMMSQTHIGYRWWQEPRENRMPEVAEIDLPEKPVMGIAVEGSAESWPGSDTEPVLPRFDGLNRQSFYVEVFNRGSMPFQCTVIPSQSWLTAGRETFSVDLQERVYLAPDWEQVPRGFHRVPVEFRGPGGSSVTVVAEIDHRELPPVNTPGEALVADRGSISVEAGHFDHAVEKDSIRWMVIPNLGRTNAGVTAMPVTGEKQVPGQDSPHLEYNVLFRDSGEVAIHSYLSPTLDFHQSGGLRFAVSLDNEGPIVVNMHETENHDPWERWVSDNINIRTSRHHVAEPGVHTIKWWLVDFGVVLQKIVIETGDAAGPTYLGPPESNRIRLP